MAVKGERINNNRQWLERIEQNEKTKYNKDIGPLEKQQQVLIKIKKENSKTFLGFWAQRNTPNNKIQIMFRTRQKVKQDITKKKTTNTTCNQTFSGITVR